MSINIITFDLNRPGQDYTDLNNAIKSFSWAKVGTTTYVISTSLSSEQLRNQLKTHIDANDKMFVGKLVDMAWSNMPDSVASWLRSATL